MKKDLVLFYTEYIENGKIHYAVHKYHPTSGIVDMMKDFKDPNFTYPICDAETLKYEEEHKNYKRYVLRHEKNKVEIQVFDKQEDRCIAKFYDTKLAKEYCEQMNLDDKYADKLEDDPWL